MDIQKRNFFIADPNRTSSDRFYIQPQEDSRETSTYRMKRFDIDLRDLTSDDSYTMRIADSDEQTSRRDDGFYIMYEIPSKKFSKKDILLGKSKIDILGRKSHINQSPRKPIDQPESLSDLPLRENDVNANTQPTKIQPRKLVKVSIRRKSCSCTCCGGMSTLERKVQHLPDFPTARTLKNNPTTIINLDLKATVSNPSGNKLRRDYSGKYREKQYGKNGITLKSLVVQAKNSSMIDGFSPKATPKNGQKLGYFSSHYKTDTVTKTLCLESKEDSVESKGELEGKSFANIKETVSPATGLHNIIEDLSRPEMTPLIPKPKDPIVNLLKKKIVLKKKNPDEDSNGKKMYYTTLKMDSALRNVKKEFLPKLKINSFAQKTEEGKKFEEEQGSPRILSEDRNIKSLKAKLGKIAGKEHSGGEKVTNGHIKGSSKLQTSHSVSSFYTSLMDRTKSLPGIKLIETPRGHNNPIDKVYLAPQVKLKTQEDEKEKVSKPKPPKLKVKKLNLLAESLVSSGVKSVRSPTSTPRVLKLKGGESARLKKSSRTEWLVKNYNIKPVGKKE